MDINEILNMMEKALPDEAIFADVLRDLVKDELKSYLKEKLDKNPDLKRQLNEAIKEYSQAKLLEITAATKFSKVIAELGIISLPADIRNDVLKSMISTFSKEIGEAIDKTL